MSLYHGFQIKVENIKSHQSTVEIHARNQFYFSYYCLLKLLNILLELLKNLKCLNVWNSIWS